MRLTLTLVASAILSAFIIGLAIWIIPSTTNNIVPAATFRYTTSIPELAHMVKIGDLIIDSMNNPIMKVSSVSIRPLKVAMIAPSGTVRIINDPQVWEVIFKANPINKGIVPPMVLGGSLYIQTPRWKKLVRVIELEVKK